MFKENYVVSALNRISKSEMMEKCWISNETNHCGTPHQEYCVKDLTSAAIVGQRLGLWKSPTVKYESVYQCRKRIIMILW